MKFARTLPLLCILIAACGGGTKAPKGWINWSSDSWDVSVAFPFEPTSNVAGSFPGVVRSESFVCRSVETYDLICVELMEAPRGAEAMKKSFESVKASIEGRSRARVVSEGDSPMGDMPGHQYRFETQDGRTYQVRVIIRDTRSYTLGAITTRGKADSEEVKTFFNSMSFK